MEAELESLGVKHVAIPRKGRPGAQRQAIESSRRFRKLVKWRTGSEGRISHLKHSWGWERTMLDGIDGASTWCGWGVLAHNAIKVSGLIEEREATQASADAKTDPTTHCDWTTRTTPANHQESRRLTSFLPLPSCPRGRKRPEDEGENDRRDRSEVLAGP